ncbi:MAG: hypothetical protein U5L72_03385 [Bacteroidales bacterium]|nr:hypothetical protein [Bacteroidales bacterium]
MENSKQKFTLNQVKINITLDKEKFTDFKLTGSKTQIEEDLINEMVKPVYEKLDLWKQKRSLVSDSIKNMKDEISKKNLRSKLIKLTHSGFLQGNN